MLLLECRLNRHACLTLFMCSSVKRKAIVENAQELKLGGISKPGFPGVVIVEGQMENVLEYVRRTQRLRWQQMVVRGEDIESVSLQHLTTDTAGYTLQGANTSNMTHDIIENVGKMHRKINSEFLDIDAWKEAGSGGGMSAVGTFCKHVGLHA